MIKLLFEFNKETKNTIRYAEVETSKIGIIYIKKEALKELGVSKADRLCVTINSADD